MAELYSKLASASLKKETTANAPQIPDTFFGITNEDLSAQYNFSNASSISGSRAINQRRVKNVIPAPAGNMNINVEPKAFGHFINGVYGGVQSGNLIKISSASAAFTVGETITGGTSSETATVVAEHNGEYLIVSSPSGSFTDGETITGGTSSSTATVDAYDSTVYGHFGTLPDNSFDSYTLQFNFDQAAIRYMGVRFHKIDALGQSDNIITAGIGCITQGQFRHAKVTAVTTTGSGTKTITVDTTYGLVAGDSVKLFRIGTGFLDFEASSDKVHTINAVTGDTTFTITDLETATAVGDLIVLAPQTPPNYSVGNEFAWIGCSTAKTGDDIDNLSTADIEDFSFVVNTEYEARHAANGNNLKYRFPKKLPAKGTMSSGTFKLAYEDEEFQSKLRDSTALALEVKSEGDEIGSTDINNELRVVNPEIYLNPYQTNLGEDAIVDEDVPYTAFENNAQGYLTRMILVNDVASY